MNRQLALLCIAVVALTAACRIGGSDQVEEVDADLLGGLNEPTAETSTPDGSDPPSTSTPAGTTTTVPTETIRLYFIEGSQLRAVDVEIPVGTSLRGQLSVLEEGPPADYADAGVRTALVPGLISGVARSGVDGARVTLDSNLFAGIDGADQRLMIGQIVLSLTDRSDFDRVSFTLDGEPLEVFLRDNTLSQPGEAVGRDDYAVLLTDAPPRTVESSSATTEASRSSVSLTSGP
jgi:Sporulation and spore germination